MILLGVGSNMPFEGCAPPVLIGKAAQVLHKRGVRIIRRSPLYCTPPMRVSQGVSQDMGADGQPDYINAVFLVQSLMPPAALLQELHRVEASFGRTRSVTGRTKWAARTLDLDLLDWHGVRSWKTPLLPHYGIADRAFVLKPLRDVAPHWRHPVSGLGLDFLLNRLPVVARAQAKRLT